MLFSLRGWNRSVAGRRLGRAVTVVATAVLVAGLAACGGKDGEAASGPDVPPSADKPASREEAARFLTQATFGPRTADVDYLMQKGLSAWITEQQLLAGVGHQAYWDAEDARLKAIDPDNAAGNREVFDSFYIGALSSNAQLRQRVAYVLSQIFVISLQDPTLAGIPRGVASYMDVLNQHAFGNYRDLLEAVSTHPMMGIYLTHLRNRKEDPARGRVPDENYAREVMQLFSIGLFELNPDGTVRQAGGVDLETYTADDIAGLAKVFTGWSWAGPDKTDARFNENNSARDPNRHVLPMQNYPQFHSVSQKSFLGVTIAPQGTADGDASLKTALDRLFNHPNVGPFIGKQLIQRLVTSNPSPAYVGRVAAVFADNGQGVRGDLGAVVRAVLLDAEARDLDVAAGPTFGKMREPVMRLTAYLRAFDATSDSGRFLIGTTDNVDNSLGQTPMRAPSVFNFFRPGFVPQGTRSGDQNLAVPEMQITHESSVVGYTNFMRGVVQNGVGQRGLDNSATRNDVQANINALLALADQPAELVALVDQRLTYGQMNADLKAAIEAAVASVAIPAPTGSNQANIDTAKSNRARIALTLALASPEYIVQK
jgi:uncharacterized protein (DUF1800 family)